LPELIAVTGATGWIGQAVCAWLEQHGYPVRRLSRSAGPGLVALDLMEPPADQRWQEALRGCTVLIHCAAHVHRPVETADECRRFQKVNVEGTGKLLHACEAAGIGRFVLAGSSAIYDWSSARPAGEDSAVAAVTAYARSKLEAENLVRRSKLSWTIARLATVYGDGDRANFLRLARGLKARRFPVPGQGSARKSVLEIGRAAELLGRLAVEPVASDLVLNLAAPQAPSLREICDAFSRQCGFARVPAMPVWAMRSIARAGDGLRLLGLPAPLTSDTLAKLTTPTVLDVGRMQHLFPDLMWQSFEDDLAKAASYYVTA